MTRMVTVRCILTVAISKGWGLHQIDVHNAFFQGNLDEDIYMKPPPSFSPLADEPLFCTIFSPYLTHLLPRFHALLC